MVQVLHNDIPLHVSPQLHILVDSLKPAMAGVFTPLKLANINNQGLFFQGEPVLKHSSTQSENHLFNECYSRGELLWIGKTKTWSKQAKATAREKVIYSILILNYH